MKRISDKLVEKNKIVSIKDNRLHIYKRANSSFWQGRTFIDGGQIVKSSGTAKLNDAKKTLADWFDEQHFKVKHGISIKNTLVKDAVEKFLIWNDETSSIATKTKRGYKDQFNIIKKYKVLMDKKLSLIVIKDLEHFIQWRIKRASSQSKVLRGATMVSNLTALSKFFNWCVTEGLLEKKHRSLGNIRKLLSKKLRSQRTTRSPFTKEEYNHLLKCNRERIKNGRSIRNRASAEQLHQFIIFMVGTGLRVEECLSLEWSDITIVDRSKNVKSIDTDKVFGKDSRYYLKINVSKSKTNERQVVSQSSSYFAYTRLMQLYKDTGIRKVFIDGETVFGVKSFREGINALLDHANLKTKKIGDQYIRYDSKSLRNTYIQFMLDKGISATAVAKNCGTSTTMIDKFYTANSTVESFLDSFLRTGRDSIKLVS